MPKRLHKALEKSARRKGLKPGTEHYNRYVYGTMAKIEGKEKKDAAQPRGTA